MQDAPPQQRDDDARPRHRAERRANWGFRVFLIVFVVLAGLAFAGNRYYGWCSEASGPKDPVAFEVRKGASGSEIVDDLHDQGVVRCGLVSKWRLRRSGLEDSLPGGELRADHEHDPRRGVPGPHDAARARAHAPAHDPRGVPADPDRRPGRGGARDPRQAVPQGDRGRRLVAAALPAEGRAEHRGVPVPRDLLRPQGRRRRRGDPRGSWISSARRPRRCRGPTRRSSA